jgi:16S rRNA (guanine527-N7)-methyltransferase
MRKRPAFSLVDSDRRKGVFLREAARQLGLKVAVHGVRVETMEPQSADVVSARALSSLGDLVELAARHMKPDGAALFLKGKNVGEELVAAKARWSFDHICYPSQTESEAFVLKVEHIRHV